LDPVQVQLNEERIVKRNGVIMGGQQDCSYSLLVFFVFVTVSLFTKTTKKKNIKIKGRFLFIINNGHILLLPISWILG